MGRLTKAEKSKQEAEREKAMNRPWIVCVEPIADFVWDGLKYKTIPRGYISVEIRSKDHG